MEINLINSIIGVSGILGLIIGFIFYKNTKSKSVLHNNNVKNHKKDMLNNIKEDKEIQKKQEENYKEINKAEKEQEDNNLNISKILEDINNKVKNTDPSKTPQEKIKNTTNRINDILNKYKKDN